MASTTFVDGETLIEAAWLNDVNAAVYTPGTTTAADIANVPAGNIAATDVQAAINELDTEKQPKDTLLTNLAAQTTAANNVQAYSGADTPTLLTTGTAPGNVPLIDGGGTVLPAGAVMHFAMNSAPTGWLKANGAAVSRVTYAALFTAVGTTYGAGDGSTTFNVPDLRGEFLRGFDDARGIDSGRAIGTAQGDAIRNITGNVATLANGGIGGNWHTYPAAASGAFQAEAAAGSMSTGGGGGGSGYSNVTLDASRQVPTAAENRPRNIALLACIKY